MIRRCRSRLTRKPVLPMMMWAPVAITPRMKGEKPLTKPSSAKYMTVTRPRPVETMVATAVFVLRLRPATRKSEMPRIAERASRPAVIVPPT